MWEVLLCPLWPKRMGSDTNMPFLLLNSFIEKKTKKIIYNIMKPISTEIVVPQYYEKTI